MLLPIVIRGRVVNLLYVDDRYAETSLSAMRVLAACIARAYEQLILHRKQGS